MTGDLLDGLDTLPTAAAARATDPDTSRDAAESISTPALRRQQALVLAAVGELIRRGAPDATARDVQLRLAYGDIQARLHYAGPAPEQNIVAKRLSELHVGGLVQDLGERRPGRSGRPLIAWSLTDKGKAVAA